MDFMTFVSSIQLLPAVCLALGFILVVIEMFHPGIGAPGVGGTILLVVGILLTATSIKMAIIMTLVLLALLGIALAIVLQSATKGKLSKKLVLFEEQRKESGYIGTDDLDYFLGKEGTALTTLRPAGTGDFAGVKMDVVTQGEFIPLGAKIKIITVQGRRIVVKEIIK